MQFLLPLVLVATASSLALAPRTNCPDIWCTIAKDLASAFEGCTPVARGCVRAPFHDCINNGCDGSLITQGECTRSENAGLLETCEQLVTWKNKYNVGAADLIQFAAAVALKTCPTGVKVQALVGRVDGTNPAPVGSVPGSRDPIFDILTIFSDKGFSAQDVVVLMGTHSIAVQRFDDPAKTGTSLDTTPDICDTVFYQETLNGTAPYSLESDKALSTNYKTAIAWQNFASINSTWLSAFPEVWDRFAVIGNNATALTDCSSVISESV